MNALEIGPGQKRTHPDWITFGIDQQTDIDYQGSWQDGLPWQENHFDLIYASHVLEHIPWYETVRVLEDACRVLKPGGSIEIWVPNFLKIVRAWMDGHTGDDAWRKYNPDGNVDLWMNGRVFTYGKQEGNWHKAAFSTEHLSYCLRESGFQEIDRLDTPRSTDHGWINLGMKGEKP